MEDNVTTVELNVNGEKAAKTLDDLKVRANKLQEAIGKAVSEGNTKGYKELDKELKRVNKEMKAIISTTANVDNVMRRLDKASPNELQATLKTLNRQLNNMERGTVVWQEHANKIKLVEAELKKVNSELKESKSWYDRLSVQINHYGLSLMSAIAGITGIVQAAKKAVIAYADMEQEMANVRKFTGMTADEIERLNETFKKMNTRSSREELNKLAQEAGRLGLQTEEDVTGFVRAADKINVALNDLGEGATLTISKLTDIFGDKKRLGVEQSMLAVGSAINELSQNSTASAPYLAEFAQRLAGVGAQAGMTIPQIMGFGAVLDSQGQAVEMSATALSKLIMNLFKQADKIAAATGMNLQKFKDTAAKDTNEALVMLLERLHEIGDMDALAPLFKEMGENGVRSSQVLAALAGNIGLVKQQQEAANKAFAEAVSIDKEFNVQNNTYRAGLDKAKKRLREITIILGKELIPVTSNIISGTSLLMRIMLKVVEFFKQWGATLLSTATAIAVYSAAVNASTIRVKLHVAWVNMATAAQKAWNAAIKSNPWGFALAAIVALTAAVATFVKRKKEVNLLEQTENQVSAKVTKQYDEQRAKINMLIDAVHNEALALGERKKALSELQQMCPDYHASLTDEGELINDNKEALDQYITSLQHEIQLQAYRERLEELYRSRIDAEKIVENKQTNLNSVKSSMASGDMKPKMVTTAGGYAPTAAEIVGANESPLNNAIAELRIAQGELNKIDDEITRINNKITQTPGLIDDRVIKGFNPKTGEGDGDKNIFAEAERWRDEEIAKNQIAYYTGRKNYEEYVQRNKEIEVEFQEQRLAICEKGTTQYLQVEAALHKAILDERKNCDGLTLEEETAFYNSELEKLTESYNKGNITARAYQLANEDAELEHLERITKIYEEGTQEQIKAQEKLEKRERQIQQRRVTEQKRIQQELRKKYFVGEDVESDEDYNLAIQNLDMVRQQMLAKHGLTAQEKLDIDRAYELARYELALQYNKDINNDTVNSAYVAGAKIEKFFRSKKFQKSWSAVNMIMSQFQEAMSTASEGIQAECDRQVAAIEAKYDKEISAAGNNEKRVAELEKKKETEISAVKADASRKTFGINIATAIADAALSIVEVWKGAMELGPIAGPIVGALLTAMVTGITAGQIATMKKQQSTASAHYATGRRGGKAEYALIGEQGPEIMYIPQGASIVPNNKLQSPQEWEQYGVPKFVSIDRAQRTNTIGSLSPTDVSGSITANQRLATYGVRNQMSESVAAQAASNIANTKVLEKLNKRLNEPFVTMNTVTGDKGIRRAQRDYDKLMKNKSK